MSAEPTADVDVSAVVLAFGAEPGLEACVRALLASEGVRAEVVLVDNGCTDGAVDRLERASLPWLIVVRPGTNLGYAAGCNEGVRWSSGRVVAFVNYDAIAEPDALARLAAATAEPGVGIATASIRLADDPALLNSAGNDIHFLGLSWSGCFNEPADRHAYPHDVTGASGAGMAMSRAVWDRLGGFEPQFFMYHDDAELSLRCLLRGLRIVYVPDAVIVHRYEFSRNPRKLYLIERNRLIMVLSSFELRTLLLLAPALVAVEACMLALSIGEGWAPAKLQSWRWLLSHLPFLRRRRREVQASRVVDDRSIAHHFVTGINPGNYQLTPKVELLNRVLAAYWRVVQRVL
jgi:GT2 family glycosyltransferase